MSITLFAFGGFTSWSSSRDLGPGRRFVISAAGSAVGIVAGLGVLGIGQLGLLSDLPELVIVFLQSFVWAGLVWGILNWIPILPLDGGHMLQHALEAVAPKRASSIARVVSLIAGVVVVAVAWRYEQRFLAIFVAMITFMGLREGRTERPPPRPPQNQTGSEPPEFPI